MAPSAVEDIMHEESETFSPPPPPLLHLLSIRPVLDCTTPYLTASSLVNLAATSHAFNHLIYRTTGVFRGLDLARVKAAHFDGDGIDRGGQIWRNTQMDEALTEDEYVQVLGLKNHYTEKSRG